MKKEVANTSIIIVCKPRMGDCNKEKQFATTTYKKAHFSYFKDLCFEKLISKCFKLEKVSS